MKSVFDTPILLILFNKVETTRLVFDAVKAIRPRQLYIAADGPRSNEPGERNKCAEVRKITEVVDWDCKVSTLFQDHNLGCKQGVSTAINWFFQNVDHGIILEDDCLPDLSFFPFCQNLLSHYKNDERIMMISGDNWGNGRNKQNASYFFSQYAFIWGWATWKRAWEKYDVEMNNYEYFRENRLIDNVFNDEKIKNYWLNCFDLVYNGKIDTWDYIWVYTLFINNGLSVIPNVNLVSNIGFGIPEASHTQEDNPRFSRIDTMPIDEIMHPEYIFADKEADRYHFERVFENAPPKKNLKKRIKTKWKSIKKVHKKLKGSMRD